MYYLGDKMKKNVMARVCCWYGGDAVFWWGTLEWRDYLEDL